MLGTEAITKATLDNYILAKLDTRSPAERAAEALAEARKTGTGFLSGPRNPLSSRFKGRLTGSSRAAGASPAKARTRCSCKSEL